MSRASSAWWWVRDRIFPTAQPFTPEECEEHETRGQAREAEWQRRLDHLPADEEPLKRHLDSCTELLADEDQRRQSVDSRLTTIIGLSSIAGSIVFGVLLSNAPRRAPYGIHWMIVGMLLYETLQIVAAMLAGVRGLERRAYDALRSDEILPPINATAAYHFRTNIHTCLETLEHHREENNQKVTQMAVAHCAVKNFIGGLLVIAVLGAAAVIVTPPRDELLERLQTDQRLRELLRGPQGLPGAQGTPGAPAPPCPSIPAQPVKPGK